MRMPAHTICREQPHAVALRCRLCVSNDRSAALRDGVPADLRAYLTRAWRHVGGGRVSVGVCVGGWVWSFRCMRFCGIGAPHRDRTSA